MSFTRLLELWAETEPARCSYASGIVVLRGWSLFYNNDATDRLTMAEIQAAVQAAIENRGWNWYLGRVRVNGAAYYKALVSIPTDEKDVNAEKSTIISTHSPAFALLEAYLQLLIKVRPDWENTQLYVATDR